MVGQEFVNMLRIQSWGRNMNFTGLTSWQEEEEEEEEEEED